MKFYLLLVLVFLPGNSLSKEPACIRDTQFCVSGRKTLTNNQCINWNASANYKIIKIFENTTLCQNSRDYYWCATNKFYYGNIRNDWDYCSLTNCKMSENICDYLTWQIYSRSIELKISYSFDLFIILNGIYSNCAIVIKCEYCDSARKTAIERFSGCQLLKIIQHRSEPILFNHLIPNKTYSIYILPISDKHSQSSVFKLSLKTKMSTGLFKIQYKNKSKIKAIIKKRYAPCTKACLIVTTIGSNSHYTKLNWNLFIFTLLLSFI